MIEKKSREFLHSILDNYNSATSKEHIAIMFSLIANERYDCLMKYLDDDVEYTRQNNYAYSIRDTIKAEVEAKAKFISCLENLSYD